jgi:hypothetical protein
VGFHRAFGDAQFVADFLVAHSFCNFLQDDQFPVGRRGLAEPVRQAFGDAERMASTRILSGISWSGKSSPSIQAESHWSNRQLSFAAATNNVLR